jgi:hypothetical protein
MRGSTAHHFAGTALVLHRTGDGVSREQERLKRQKGGKALAQQLMLGHHLTANKLQIAFVRGVVLQRVDSTGAPITYDEYYLPKMPGDKGPWGPNRLIIGSDNNVYYSWTHYGKLGEPAFVWLGTILP